MVVVTGWLLRIPVRHVTRREGKGAMTAQSRRTLDYDGEEEDTSPIAPGHTQRHLPPREMETR